MRYGIQALLWIVCITSAWAQVAPYRAGVDHGAGKFNPLSRIVSDRILEDKPLLDSGNRIITSTQPARF
jgi:hypothetical protein